MNKKELNDYYTIESDKIFAHQTNLIQFQHQEECLLTDSRTINQHNYRDIHLAKTNLVDIESDLTNRTRPLSKNPAKKFNPEKSNLKVEDINKLECDSSFINNKKVDYKFCSIKDGKFICHN